jgi:hypothetical protein
MHASRRGRLKIVGTPNLRFNKGCLEIQRPDEGTLAGWADATCWLLLGLFPWRGHPGAASAWNPSRHLLG